MAVPTEPPFDPMAAHGLVPRYDVLHVAREEVAVVREAVGERRTVVEDELVVLRALLDRTLERLLILPSLEQFALDGREVRSRRDVGVRRGRIVAAVGVVGHAGSIEDSEG